MHNYSLSYLTYNSYRLDPNFMVCSPEVLRLGDLRNLSEQEKVLAKFFSFQGDYLKKEPSIISREFNSENDLYDIARYLEEEAGRYQITRSHFGSRARLTTTINQVYAWKFAGIFFEDHNMAKRAADILTEGLFFQIPDEPVDCDGRTILRQY